MPNLMDLPIELRCIIYQHTVCGPILHSQNGDSINVARLMTLLTIRAEAATLPMWQTRKHAMYFACPEDLAKFADLRYRSRWSRSRALIDLFANLVRTESVAIAMKDVQYEQLNHTIETIRSELRQAVNIELHLHGVSVGGDEYPHPPRAYGVAVKHLAQSEAIDSIRPKSLVIRDIDHERRTHAIAPDTKPDAASSADFIETTIRAGLYDANHDLATMVSFRAVWAQRPQQSNSQTTGLTADCLTDSRFLWTSFD